MYLSYSSLATSSLKPYSVPYRISTCFPSHSYNLANLSTCCIDGVESGNGVDFRMHMCSTGNMWYCVSDYHIQKLYVEKMYTEVCTLIHVYLHVHDCTNCQPLPVLRSVSIVCMNSTLLCILPLTRIQLWLDNEGINAVAAQLASRSGQQCINDIGSQKNSEDGQDYNNHHSYLLKNRIVF